eukprot:TRINITY_DN689_c1_g4_i1.p1 TRINITY_DN689_c1_g4~~TRINITY_DN689_c1_g4_i1.p1  ORF type:complete len:166 (+),score=23.16 TRINITY_DN689_c1_g4_i1:212-709(+)
MGRRKSTEAPAPRTNELNKPSADELAVVKGEYVSGKYQTKKEAVPNEGPTGGANVNSEVQLEAGQKPPVESEEQLEEEVVLLQILDMYPPAKLAGMHRHFVLMGLKQHLRRRLNRQRSAEDILRLLKTFYALEQLVPDDKLAELERPDGPLDFSFTPDSLKKQKH